VINVDGHPAYARATAELKNTGKLGRRCRCRPCPYLNNIVEQDHRFIKKRIAASLWFRSVEGAVQTVAGYEAMHAIRKGQIRWLSQNEHRLEIQTSDFIGSSLARCSSCYSSQKEVGSVSKGRRG
jgi:transposase-like protein